jgi:hypothetical protein
VATTLARPVQTRLSFQQLEQLWISNGGSPTWAPTMAAVALAESGGNPTALNNNPATGDYSVGLWQINYFGSLLGPRTAQYGSPQALAADPNAQAKAAINLLGSGSGISNWEGDPVGAAVVANGGTPLSPSQAQSVAGGGSVPGTTTPGGAATLTAATAGSCDSSKYLINVLGAHFISQCQEKAIKGGLLVLAGGVLMLVGTVAVIAKSGIGKKAIEATGAAVIYEKVTQRRPPRSDSVTSSSGSIPSGSPDRRSSASSKGARSYSADEAYDQPFDESNES